LTLKSYKYITARSHTYIYIYIYTPRYEDNNTHITSHDAYTRYRCVMEKMKKFHHPSARLPEVVIKRTHCALFYVAQTRHLQHIIYIHIYIYIYMILLFIPVHTCGLQPSSNVCIRSEWCRRKGWESVASVFPREDVYGGILFAALQNAAHARIINEYLYIIYIYIPIIQWNIPHIEKTREEKIVL